VILKSNVTLYIEAGATLLGSTRLSDYTPQPGPDPMADANQRHLVFARDARNIGLAGPGRIDGQGSAFWTHQPRGPVPEELRWRDALHSDWKHGERVSPMIELVGCSDVRIDGLTITGASGWTMRPINCTRVFISGIHLTNPYHGPNTDGIDATGCQDMMISDCVIDTGDDAICLKSENPYGGEARLTRNVTVTNCVISSSTNGFKIGTATQGEFENIVFSNSVIHHGDRPLNERSIAGIALEMADGGWLEGVIIAGIQIQRARAPLFIRRGNRSNAGRHPQSRLRGITIEGLRATGAVVTSSITGLPGMPVEDVRLSDISIDTVMPGRAAWIADPVPEAEAKYPEPRALGWLPASGLFCRHVRGLTMRDVSFSAPVEEYRTTVLLDDVQDATLAGLRASPVRNGLPVLTCVSTRELRLSGAVAPVGSQALLEVRGAANRDLLVTGCDLRAAGRVATGDVAAVQAEFNSTAPSNPAAS